MASNFIDILIKDAEGQREYVGMANLKQGTEYKIHNFRFMDLNGKRTIVMDLDNFWTILPPRLSTHIKTLNDLEELCRANLSLIYNGTDSSRGGMHLIQLKRNTPTAASNNWTA